MKYPGNNISTLTLEDLKKLSTKRLLNIKRISWRGTSICDDYVWDCGCCDCVADKENYSHWQDMIDNCKTVLAEREHVEPKGKRKKKA